ncbi:exodeoxyribonuclease V subunit beta [Nitrincola tapanii]|uniref:RecBCD enzyme subunit RecB n=1 Tax=Nitrincola tapanii TaxID=1708751 RepID=A0A5A9W458_9GAMM|nr:exodeoxyribonuclease V subunit beta [Nitrincola tapanii]KAA0875293.1 exodeoxyribonuclease V subunit beta [Nitrincola tapanii]
MNANPLVLNQFPLHASQLIEASAGTGKTFTIALLYTRLILQHGGEAAFVRPLSPDEILVVTFTEAATQELKERIRARLVEAAACFRVTIEDAPAAGDNPLLQLRDDFPPERWPACARLLSLAAQSMDQAAISTIHGWCYRMLREHAFDSGSLFTPSLLTDPSEQLAALIRDYWRIHFYPLQPAQAALVQSIFKDPDQLLQALKPFLNWPDAELTLADQPFVIPEQLDSILAEASQALTQLAQAQQTARQCWAEDIDTLEALLWEYRPALNKTSYREAKEEETFAQLLQELRRWAEEGEAPQGKLERFAQGQWKLSGGKKAPQAPEHPAFTALAHWHALNQTLAEQDLSPWLLAHASRWLQTALGHQLQKQAELRFDDLLLQLDQALTSEQGDALAAQIRQSFPVALIDEFQDTDPVQYRIFQRIYAQAHADQPSAWIMIGDPKQAIYSFRGADIHTYLAARQATQGRHYNLDTNYRSSLALVRAVNYVFTQAEAYPRGAFRFQTEEHNPLPFLEVKAQGRAAELFLSGQAATALNLWHLEGEDAETPINTQTYRDEMAERCASQICEWLNAPEHCGFQEGEAWRALQPKDLAILVRGHGEAQVIRDALQARGLASVYLSDRDSIFAAQEAQDILIWLQACADPADDLRLRRALATPSMHRTLAELDALQNDEWHWEQETEAFRNLQRTWRQQGVLPMLHQLLHHWQLPKRALLQPEGERQLTNLLHLAEWLQAASQQQEGEQGLIRHLAEQLQNPDHEEILRLESDADLIRVITIHKSKGLEYPLVLLPFISNWRGIDKQDSALAYVETRSNAEPSSALSLAQRRLALGTKTPRTYAEELADDQRLSEDLRLLYVALTRARHALFLGVACLRKGQKRVSEQHLNALGYLLAGGDPLTPASFAEHLARWAQEPDIDLSPAPQIRHDRVERVRGEEDQGALLSPRSPYEHWWIASYSALKTGAMSSLKEDSCHLENRVEPESAREARLQEETLDAASSVLSSVLSTAMNSDEPPPALAQGIHAFARGPAAGTFLHHLLEWAAEVGFAQAFANADARQAWITQACRLRGWEAFAPLLDTWLQSFLAQSYDFKQDSTQALHLPNLSLWQAEMEFMLASHQVCTEQLDALCHTYLCPGEARPRLEKNQLNGMLKGFIDLVFEHQGQYYVADWKSNYLGPNASSYTPAAIRQSLLQKRYDVQYLLYLLALHRLLKQRLPNYHYSQHLGGALYFYLRGFQAPQQGVYFDKPPQACLEALDQLFRGEAA